ncbi:hypothetical protein JW933_08125 [candidate division FCPU426 bacterium]|nr:hypothetical protein [candidate division FCPU426 bacterium]
MKKLQVVYMLFMFSGFLISMASAHQDESFTSRATAGMFEEMYDYFKYSPAYMPGFERNALWSQLSNMYSQGDQMFDGTSSPSYFIAAQNDLMGMGRLGVAIDFLNLVSPVENLNYEAPDSHMGFGEQTTERYLDTDGDEIIDLKREGYSKGEATDYYSASDIYVAFGMGNISGFDLGIGVRGGWESYNPTYTANHPYFGGLYSDPVMSFDREARVRDYDLLTGQELYRFDESATGSMSLASSTWRLILSGRSRELMPGLDVVLNAAPVLYNVTNDYESEFRMSENSSPADPMLSNEQSVVVTDEGCELGLTFPLLGELYGYSKPASGFGVDTDLRLDTDVAGVHLTGWAGYYTLGFTYQDAKRDVDMREHFRGMNWFVGVPVIETYDTQSHYNYAWDGSGGESDILARVRVQIPFQGWRLGLGIGGNIANSNWEETLDWSVSMSQRFFRDNSDPADDFNYRIAAHEKYKIKYDTTDYNLDLPVGIVIDVLKNFALQVGARHRIAQSVINQSRDIVETEIPETLITYDDGLQYGGVQSPWTNLSGQIGGTPDAMNSFSRVTVSHSTNLYYGISWWPFEQVQVEMYGLGYLQELWQYHVSVNLYY